MMETLPICIVSMREKEKLRYGVSVGLQQVPVKVVLQNV